MKICRDCREQLPHDCICEPVCDWCKLKEPDCTCGRDRDPYGNKIFDHAEWLRGLEDASNVTSLDAFEGKYTAGKEIDERTRA